MLCKLSLKRLLYVLFLFSILICLHVLITVINNGTNYNNIRHRFNAADITEKPITSKFVKKNGSKVVTQITEKIIVPEKPITTTTEEVYNKDNQLPWYFKNGSKGPKINEEEYNKIWPWQAAGDDRITNQLMHIPKDYDKNVTPLKTILLWAGLDPWVKAGRLVDNCPVNRCSLTDDHAQAPNVDAIIFRDRLAIPSSYDRPPKQVWIINLLECPFHTDRFQYNDLINWTATYRRDSDIVTPYERWVYYDENVKQKPTLERNFAANKTRLVAWFVSNCNAKNDRQKYAHELQKHISVDIYGFCGTLKCPRTQECFRRLDTTYKFYLAFENSNCVEYITEKFFLNGLQHDILPIVMGARPEDYAAVAPYHSYIHVDDFASPKELAQYLHKLDKDDDLYNSYFGWKGTGEFINTHFLCRVCTMLHSDYPTKSYPNLNKWWKNITTCTNSRPWHKERKPSLSYKLPS